MHCSSCCTIFALYKTLYATGLMQALLSEAVLVMVCSDVLLFVLVVSFFVDSEGLLFVGFALSDFLEIKVKLAVNIEIEFSLTLELKTPALKPDDSRART